MKISVLRNLLRESLLKCSHDVLNTPLEIALKLEQIEALNFTE